jgi:hypothetical protein
MCLIACDIDERALLIGAAILAETARHYLVGAGWAGHYWAASLTFSLSFAILIYNP